MKGTFQAQLFSRKDKEESIRTVFSVGWVKEWRGGSSSVEVTARLALLLDDFHSAVHLHWIGEITGLTVCTLLPQPTREQGTQVVLCQP